MTTKDAQRLLNMHQGYQTAKVAQRHTKDNLRQFQTFDKCQLKDL